MFSTSSKADRTAAQAWDYLSSAMSTAGETAAKAASVAGDRGHDLADEAWLRASAAADALAGRRPGRPWALVALAGLAGVAVGWCAAVYARRALAQEAAAEERELAETAVIVAGKDT
jgi:ferric-dicitrate binding protein FerR (iron transport regulator)